MTAMMLKTSARDSDRVEHLDRVRYEIRHHDGGSLSKFLLDDAARIWGEVISAGSRYLIGNDESRQTEQAAASETFVSRMEQSRVDEIVLGFARVDLSDDQLILPLLLNSISALRNEFTDLARASADGRAEIPKLLNDSGGFLDPEAQIATWKAQLQMLAGSVDSLRLLLGLQDRSKEMLASAALATTEADQAANHLAQVREELASAKAERAQGELAGEFAALSSREGATSWVLRAFTLALLGLAVVVALALPSGATWQEAFGHVAVVATIGGAAAYSARLASNHRTVADWARSVEVQLSTFQDFLGAIGDTQVKNRLYEDFGRRVLGPPPAGVADDTGAMPTSQVVELASAIATARSR